MIHILRKFFSRIKIFLIAIPLLYYYKFFGNSKRISDKAVLIRLKHNHFKRYLYILVKFLYMEGYIIYVTIDFVTFYNLRTDQFCAYLFCERIICVRKPPKKIKVILLDESILNADYFSTLQLVETSSDIYHVPMSQHPLMYKTGWWNEPIIGKGKKKQSLFMAGNFDENTYAIEQDGIFKTLSRLWVYSLLQDKQLLYPIDSLQNLQSFYDCDIDYKIILINRLKLNIPMDELRQWLAKFDFFFALPGVVMPFSHNIIEAMSVGCIPFLQQSYADMFKPPLVNNIQAVTFLDMSDLEEKLKYLFSLDCHKIWQMRHEVNTYYNSFLTPSKVVANLEKVNFKNIYLQAEHYSVSLFNKTENIEAL